ncbi:hypothetical protein [Actinoplanes couchii]|uniref:Uncharacterized protein n=1 Tax=Actinoplanes couchii TaxID=403638 RepID=A0ABQ3XLT8_9ACTN|nr:hypothetical protein [Actinoplanes couchii]MDR6319339.1 hypothetical protein [Actinoplanes couchii]GID59451.1 hypothetical protein Aco03nite_078550 [Actinoplanes couchii]
MTDHWDHDDFDYDLPDDAHHDDVTPELPALDHPDLDLPDLPELPHLPDLGDIELPDVSDTLSTVTEDLFPPALDVELPEPVDGFPWVDTATLGAPDISGFIPPVDAVTPEELAAHAGIEIPPGADAWTFLSTSEDPATAALARWWTTQQS